MLVVVGLFGWVLPRYFGFVGFWVWVSVFCLLVWVLRVGMW